MIGKNINILILYIFLGLITTLYIIGFDCKGRSEGYWPHVSQSPPTLLHLPNRNQGGTRGFGSRVPAQAHDLREHVSEMHAALCPSRTSIWPGAGTRFRVPRHRHANCPAPRLTPHASAWHAGVACRHDWAPSHAGCQSGSRRALRRARAAHLPRLAACCLISSNWRRTERTWLGLGFGLRLGLGLGLG